MRVDRLKRLVAPVWLAVAALVVVLAVVGAGVLQHWATTSGTPAPAFTDVPDGASALADVVVWEPDGPLQGRVVEPATRVALEAAWTRAWEARQRAAAGDPSLLPGSFSGGALAQAEALAEASGARVQLVPGAHHLAVTFYSDDGAVVGLHAAPVRVHEVVERAGRRVVRSSDDTYDVVLLLEDGTWRIRQWIRTASVPVEPALPGS